MCSFFAEPVVHMASIFAELGGLTTIILPLMYDFSGIEAIKMLMMVFRSFPSKLKQSGKLSIYSQHQSHFINYIHSFYPIERILSSTALLYHSLGNTLVLTERNPYFGIEQNYDIPMKGFSYCNYIMISFKLTIFKTYSDYLNFKLSASQTQKK